ncbi:ubiquitin-protein ligase, putative [Ricinus communis]|uniref:Ubiquitin-protein ligase, putative n=1 Tax=Ricinus communis TaxID=3988 RepID=B9RZH8_RICCO|nr:ubiquitin-protein ligase, putative [Ricinus communis]
MVSARRKRAESTKTNVSIKDENKGGEEGGIKRKGYEEFREQRIKENMERMHKLGILELSRNFKFKPFPIPPKDKTLKSLTPVDYSVRNLRRKRSSKGFEIRLQKCFKPEIYTEEHEKLLGDCKTAWTLFVDGYGMDGKLIRFREDREICHQCRQKSLGRHTHCSKCMLVRGTFVGIAYIRVWHLLHFRNWKSSSHSEKANGWAPTGQVYRTVSRLGFKSVAHYLIQTRRGQIHPEDSGLANLDPEGRDLAPADKGLQLLANNESLSADKHQDRYPDLHTNRDKLRWKKRKNKCNALTLLMDMVIISNADDELKREKIYGYAAILLTRCIWQVTLVFMAALLGVSVNCFWYIE